MRNQIIFVAVAICLLVTGLLLTAYYRETSYYVRYEGEEAFVTIDEYTDFVNYLATADDLHVLDMDFLPPVWVEYNIRVPRTSPFPFDYDRVAPSSSDADRLVISAFRIVTGATGVLVAGLCLVRVKEACDKATKEGEGKNAKTKENHVS